MVRRHCPELFRESKSRFRLTEDDFQYCLQPIKYIPMTSTHIQPQSGSRRRQMNKEVERLFADKLTMLANNTDGRLFFTV